MNIQLDKKKQPWSAVYNRAPFDTIQVRNDATFLVQPEPLKYSAAPKPSPTKITTQDVFFHPLLSANKGKITTSLCTAVKYLADEFREIFHLDSLDSDRLAKASALYTATPKRRGDILPSFPRTIAPSLCDTIPPRRIHDKCNVRTATSVYHLALVKCGFAQSDLLNDKAWRIDLKVTVNRDFHIDFDEKFEIVRIGERPFIWMLATVVGDRSNSPASEKIHDIRLRMESYRTLDQNSELFKHLFPDGIPSPILSLGEDNDPIFDRHLKGRVKLIKHNSICHFYKLDNTTAKVCSGIEYDGNNTQIRRIFCEMSLYHSELELREAITNGCVINEVQSIIAKAMNISLDVSNAISIMTNNL